MKDNFGRDITYLRLSVTEFCNLRCRYCMPAEGICKKRHEDMLTEDEMICAVEAAASLGVSKLRITGGEPLVKKNILSICERAAAVEGIEEVCLTTNGEKIIGLTLTLDFFDRCGNCVSPSSATGSGEAQFPTSFARRSITRRAQVRN